MLKWQDTLKWREPKQASSCSLLFCKGLASLMSGLASSSANAPHHYFAGNSCCIVGFCAAKKRW